jgi:putative ABC transport system permease protein
MRWLRVWLLRLGGLFRRERHYQEFAQEVESHLQLHIEDNIRSGMTPEEARRKALIKFGSIDAVMEDYGKQSGIPAIETLVQDVCYGFRMLAKAPSLTAIVVITLALGIGVNTAIFSVLNGWLLRPLPVQAPEQIMVLAPQQEQGPRGKFSYADLLDFRKQAEAFSDLFAYGFGASGLSFDGKANEFVYSAVTGNYFSALGVRPVLGRLFFIGEGEKPGDALLVVLGYSYWQRKFGGDPGVVGKQVLVNGQAAMVVGVAPREFHGSLFAFDMDGYLSLNMMSRGPDSRGFWSDRTDRDLFVQGRLKPGVSLAQAKSSVDVIAQRLAAQYPGTDSGVTVRVIPERLARPAPLVASFAPIVAGLFLGLAALVLALACVNVANILLARAAARQREMAIRAAVGAGRWRLIRQMLTETLLLAFLGGIAGVLLGEWAISASGSFLHSVTTTPNFGYRMDCSFDWKVFTYTLAAVVLAGILVGIWPAFRASRADVNALLHQVGRSDSIGAGHHRLRGILVVAQLAGSLMLLTVAGLFVRSLGRAENMFLGFDPDHVLTVLLDPHQVGYDQTRTKTFYRELKDRVGALPGVQSASLASAVPMEVPASGSSVYVEGHPLASGQQPAAISFNSIDPAYFQTMRVPLLQGRTFTEADNETARPVALVNQTMARKLWPSEDPIGKRFSIKSATGPFIEVVGVAGDGQYMFVSPEHQPYFYVPLAQNYSSFRSLQVRSSVSPESLITGVQQEIRHLEPDLPLIDVRTMDQVVQGLGGLFIFRLAASLAALMGILGLALAVVGVYGVVSFSVTRRTQEIGIRRALGAERGDILMLVSRQGLRLLIAGVVAGLVVAYGLTRAIAKLLMGVSATDPTTYTLVTVLLSVVTLLAIWIPARRATRVDPMVALRYE